MVNNLYISIVCQLRSGFKEGIYRGIKTVSTVVAL